MPQLFRFTRRQGESLRVRALSGHKVLVSQFDQEDFVALREGQRVVMGGGEFCQSFEAQYLRCGKHDGCVFAFIFDDSALRSMHVHDLREGQFIQVLAEAC